MALGSSRVLNTFWLALDIRRAGHHPPQPSIVDYSPSEDQELSSIAASGPFFLTDSIAFFAFCLDV